MKSIILNEPGDFDLIDKNFDLELASNEVLMKVHRIGICGTDLHAYEGNQPFFSYPRILGHELGLEVVEIGDEVSNVKVGEKCTIEPYKTPNPSDQAVRRGKTNCAENISVFGVHEDGGMREYFKYPSKYVHRSEKLSYEQLALVEPLCIGCHGVNRAQVSEDDNVVVVGVGPIGLSTIQFAKATGAKVVALEMDANRIKFCRDELNIECVNAGSANVESDIRKCFDGDLPTIVLDATGNPKSMTKAFEYVAHGGILVFIGLFQGDLTFHDPYFHKKELTLMSSRNALPTDFDQVIRDIEEGKIDTNPWITHRAKFDRMIDHFDDWLLPESKVIKAMVEL